MNNKSVINRLERKFGRFAIKNLIIYILLAYVVGYILVILDSRLHIYDYITMNPQLVMQGQVWRLFTWICTVPQTLGFFVVFMFILYYFIGKSLENTLGSFKYNLYMISGWFFMTLGAMVVYWVTAAINGPSGGVSLEISTYYLNLASFLAFALLYPNQEVYFFFLIPIKMKWLAILDVAYLVYNIVTYIIGITRVDQIDFSAFGVSKTYYISVLYAQIFSIIISLLNFIIFYFMVRKVTPKNIKGKMKEAQDRRRRQQEWQNKWGEARNSWKEQGYQNGETKWNEKGGNNNAGGFDTGADTGFESRADKKRRERTSKYNVNEYEHRCEICGRTNITDPDLTFRYCSKCEGNHEYCEDHIFDHKHYGQQ